MAVIRRYIQGSKFIYVDEAKLREECYEEMRECSPDGTSEELLNAMAEYLFKLCTTPKH